MFLAENTIQLVPDGTLLLHVILIAVMVAIVNSTLLKPVNKILKDREIELRNRQSEAERLASEQQEKVRRYDVALRDARTEGYKLLEHERAEANRQREERLRDVKQEAQRVVSLALETTEAQQQQARMELEAQAGRMGALITDRILRGAG
ncbi:MAG: ATP synthase F0 subunit B [Pyrinomonadaceae bacterium]